MIRYLLSLIILPLFGWYPAGKPPAIKKYVYIAAPHTSNWDFIWFVVFSWRFKLQLSWMGKHTMFRPPYGWLLRAFGGIPIYRHQKNDMVQQMADKFSEVDCLCLVIPAEGTRGLRDHWKSGFYRIAQAANVPIVPGFLDYGKKQAGFGPPFVPKGDFGADMDILRAFYADKTAKFPDKFSPVRLREEDEAPHTEKT